MSASAEVEGFKVSSYVLSKYEIHRVVGEGEYGVVYSARNIEDETPVAIKKIKDYAADEIRESLAKMILRELKMLQHFRGHDNIVSLVDVFIDDKDKHLYFVTELMDTTLHSVIYSKQPLTLQHIQFFAYQILRGLKFLHSAKVMHRDLKPGNILVNSACDVKICDLGMARSPVDSQLGERLTVKVVTRWYRAPELLLCSFDYDFSIDIWAVGCILLELFLRKPAFPGDDYVGMIKLQISKIGNPSKEDQQHLCENAVRFLSVVEVNKKFDWSVHVPSAEATDLMLQLLQFNPQKRVKAGNALQHPFFQELHDPECEPECDKTFDFDYERDLHSMNSQEVKQMIEDEVSAHQYGSSRRWSAQSRSLSGLQPITP
mmetsp:Transcript_13521/g.31122  ORF Transcript_13521/g.31122 Transcript_13521/m.31122 type:complete len:374 (-) Transcript_13521:135-1256(-)